MSSINLDTDFYETEDPIWNPALLTIPVPGIRRMVNLASTMDDVIRRPKEDFPRSATVAVSPRAVIQVHLRNPGLSQDRWIM